MGLAMKQLELWPKQAATYILLHCFLITLELTSIQIALWYSQATNTDILAATIAKDFGVQAKAYKCAVESYDEVRRSNTPSPLLNPTAATDVP